MASSSAERWLASKCRHILAAREDAASQETKGRPGPQEDPRQGRGPKIPRRIAPRSRCGGKAKRPARTSPKTGKRRSLRTIADELAVARASQCEWQSLQRQVDPQHAGRGRARAPTDSKQLTERNYCWLPSERHDGRTWALATTAIGSAQRPRLNPSFVIDDRRYWLPLACSPTLLIGIKSP